PLDEVEFIQLRQAVGDLRQVPALGWRTTTNSSSVIQRPIALKDTTDGAQRRQGASPATAKLGADGDRAKLAEITLLFKLFAKRQHALLDFRRNAIGNLSRRARKVTERSPIETFAFRSRYPAFDGRHRNAKGAGHSAKRLT